MGLHPCRFAIACTAAIAVVAGIAVPLSYNDELYALRTHIDLVREQLNKGRA